MTSAASRSSASLAFLFLAATVAIGKPPEDLGTRAAGEDWPTFLGPRGDNKSTETGIRTDWGTSGPPLVWERKIGTGYGGPSIARGRLFLFERHGDRARLVCRHSETGEERWRYEYPTDYEDYYGYNNGPRTTPVVGGDRVYVHGVEGELHCVSISGEGKLVWKVDTREKFGLVQNFFGVGSTPVVEGDRLFVHVGGSPPDSPPIHSGQVRPDGSGIVAFDRETGEVLYRSIDELASYASPTFATIGGRRWGFLFARGGLVGFDPESGQQRFHYPWRARKLESVNASNPVIVGDEVFISETYGPGSSLLRVEDDGFEVVWKDPPGRRKAMQTHWNTAIHHEGYLYGSSGRNSGDAELRCVEWSSGEVQWSIPRLGRSSLLYADGHLVCLTEYGEVLLVRASPERFELTARVRIRDKEGEDLLRYPCWAAPVLSHGLLYLRGDGRIVCLELIPAPEPGGAAGRGLRPDDR